MHKSIWIVNYKYVDIAKISIYICAPVSTMEYGITFDARFIYAMNLQQQAFSNIAAAFDFIDIWKSFSLNQMWVQQSDGVSPSFSNPFHLFIFSRCRWSILSHITFYIKKTMHIYIRFEIAMRCCEL